MQKIKITFDGFWKGFDPQNNFLTNALRRNFEVTVLPLGNYSVDAVFYSIYATEFLNYNCVRIYYTGENAVPDFNLCDYAIGFEQLALGDRFFRYPVSHADFHEDCVLMENKNKHLPEKPFNRKFCAMVVSNSVNADSFREDFFYRLSGYRMVDSGGKYLNNIGHPEGVTDKKIFLRQYKFSLAFENVSHVGYCTEKLPQSFASGTIPIYWGDPNVTQYFNPKSFINLHDYGRVDDAISEIKRIDNDEHLYLSMLYEPAIIKPEFLCENLDREFEKWLVHIFVSDIANRLRANRNGYARIYSEKQRRLLSYRKDSDMVLMRRIKYIFTHSPKDVIKKIMYKLKSRDVK